MAVVGFPDPRKTGPEGLLALGGDLSPETLRMAYGQGIFPWPIEGAPALTWFCPPERAILDFADLHVPRSLQRFLRKSPLRLTANAAFEQVITACKDSRRPGQPGTWITPAMRRAYIEFHRQGCAHSIEAWDGERLVGGMYGVYLDGAFAGESMFHREPNASKAALLYCVRLLSEAGVDWLDVQQLTPHLQALGAKLIPRDEFLSRLQRTHGRFQDRPCPFPRPA